MNIEVNNPIHHQHLVLVWNRHFAISHHHLTFCQNLSQQRTIPKHIMSSSSFLAIINVINFFPRHFRTRKMYSGTCLGVRPAGSLCCKHIQCCHAFPEDSTTHKQWYICFICTHKFFYYS